MAKSKSLTLKPPSQLSRIEIDELLSLRNEGDIFSLLLGVAGMVFHNASRLDDVLSTQAEHTVLLRQIEQEINQPAPPLVVRFATRNEDGTMTIQTSAALTAGGTLDQLNIVDENGVVLDRNNITFSAPIGEAASTDLVEAPSADGNGTNFTASLTAPTETVTLDRSDRGSVTGNQ